MLDASRASWSQAALALAIASVGLGCIGIEHRVRGVVVYDRTEGCSDVPPRTGASGAIVTVTCSDQDEPLVTTTEVGGRFVLEPDDALGPSCAVTVEKEGYVTRRYSMVDICAHAMDGGRACEAGSLTAHLVPRPPAPDPGAASDAPEASDDSSEAQDPLEGP
jgi:hypothetical protein